MEDFIRKAAGSLGISEDVGRSATGGVLDLLKKKAGGAEFDQLLDKVPGAGDLLAKFGSGGGGGGSGGLMGGLMSKAGSLLGGDAGSLMGMLGKSGLDPEKGTSFVGMLVSYLKEKAGATLLSSILSKVPDLKALVG